MSAAFSTRSGRNSQRDQKPRLRPSPKLDGNCFMCSRISSASAFLPQPTGLPVDLDLTWLPVADRSSSLRSTRGLHGPSGRLRPTDTRTPAPKTPVRADLYDAELVGMTREPVSQLSAARSKDFADDGEHRVPAGPRAPSRLPPQANRGTDWRTTQTHRENQLQNNGLRHGLAERTGLEPATPGVTGQYSKPTELPLQFAGGHESGGCCRA